MHHKYTPEFELPVLSKLYLEVRDSLAMYGVVISFISFCILSYINSILIPSVHLVVF